MFPNVLNWLKCIGGVECINFNENDVADKINELVPKGLYRAIDCAGFRYSKGVLHKVERSIGLETDTSEVLNEIICSTAKFGTISVVADYAAYTNHVLIGGVMEKGLRLIGCGQAPVQSHWETFVDYLMMGEFDPTVILTHRFALEETPKVYERFDKKEAGIIKIFLQTKYSPAPMPGTPKLTKVDDAA